MNLPSSICTYLEMSSKIDLMDSASSISKTPPLRIRQLSSPPKSISTMSTHKTLWLYIPKISSTSVRFGTTFPLCQKQKELASWFPKNLFMKVSLKMDILMDLEITGRKHYSMLALLKMEILLASASRNYQKDYLSARFGNLECVRVFRSQRITKKLAFRPRKISLNKIDYHSDHTSNNERRLA